MSNTKFYDILQIQPDANREQIAAAFRKLALRTHPLKNPDQLSEYTAKFNEICEAYEVLSNVDYKMNYDKYGEKGLY